ncbi:MAG TPA: CYTH and CHAD domain-containing protein [Kineosporiaceae bacterium]|nr:CYTH and CHAD domain-containing protein [Kineosporiaceae bacterium]
MGRQDVSLEVEAKYDLDASVTPALDALPGSRTVTALEKAGTRRLSATYYDTPGLDLLRHGITLRRRTGGTDAGWHLKLPAGTGRLEVHRPAGRSGAPVPAELTALVRAVLRDRVPEPVVRLRTTRDVTRVLGRDGAVLAEVADDTVTAEAPGGRAESWREVEVELVAGKPRLLATVGDLLRAQGATPSRYGSKLARALDGRVPAEPVPNAHRGPRRGAGAGDVVLGHLRALRDELLACDPLVRLDAPDAVHRMRVATRRMRSALASFRPLFTPDSAVALREELAWLAAVLGAARDAEVLRDLLGAQVEALPADLRHGPVAERIATQLEQAYHTAHEEAVAELDGARYLTLLVAVDAFVADPPFARPARRPADRELPALLARTVRRVTRELAAARAEPGLPERELRSHEVRKAAKRARYTAEALSPLFGSPSRDVARRMRQVQETLGSHQDSLLARDWLLAAASRAQAAGEPTFTYGFLHARQWHGDGDTDANLAAADALLPRSATRWPRTRRR